MTPEQVERKRKYDREYSARRYAEGYRESAEKLLKRASAWKKANPARVAANQAKWRNTDIGYLSSCKSNLARQLGVIRKDLPDELVEAKFAQLKVIRLIRDLG